MKEFNTITVGEKLARMGKRLQRLNRFHALTLDDFLEDEDIQTLIERLLEQVIQSALDINRAFLKRVGRMASEDVKALTNSQTFILAGQYGLISSTLANQMEKSGGFRNVLAHLYDEIIAERVYEALQGTLIYYPQYLAAVEAYLDSMEQPDAE